MIAANPRERSPGDTKLKSAMTWDRSSRASSKLILGAGNPPASIPVSRSYSETCRSSSPRSTNTGHSLIKLIGGRDIRFQGHGRDKYGRTLATIFVFDDGKREWMNVNVRMVLRGHAWVSKLLCNHLPKERQDELLKMQRWARRKRVGLWRDPNPIPPWKWRNGDNTSP